MLQLYGFINCNKCTILRQDVNNKDNYVWSIWELTTILSIFLQVQDCRGGSLAVQWLGPCVLTANGPGSISGQGTKIPQAVWHSQKQANKKCCRKLSIFKEPFGLLMVTGDSCGKW